MAFAINCMSHSPLSSNDLNGLRLCYFNNIATYSCIVSDSTDRLPPIIPSFEDETIDFQQYAFDTSFGAAPIDCIWFESDVSAYSASFMDAQTVQQIFEDNQAVQEHGEIICENQEIHLEARRYTLDA